MTISTLRRLVLVVLLLATFVFVRGERAAPAHAQTANLRANFRLFGEVNRFGLGWGDMDIHFGVNVPAGDLAPSIGRMEYVAGGAFQGSGVLSGLSLPSSGFAVVDVEFSVPFPLEIDEPASLYLGFGDNGMGGARVATCRSSLTSRTTCGSQDRCSRALLIRV